MREKIKAWGREKRSGPKGQLWNLTKISKTKETVGGGGHGGRVGEWPGSLQCSPL